MNELTPSSAVAGSPESAASPAAPIPAAPRGVFAALSELLRHPFWSVRRVQMDGPLAPSFKILAAGLVCFGAYGAAAGFFQGGHQIGVAAVKAPLIALSSLLLCLPSFFVFGLLSGADVTLRRAVGLLSLFFGLLGLLLVGLLPIGWLFSFSSSSLLFATWLHVVAWAMALWFGWRLLRLAFPHTPTQRVSLRWTVLFAIVSFQMATVLRPVLYRAEGQPLVESAKLFFIEHLGSLSSPDGKKK